MHSHQFTRKLGGRSARTGLFAALAFALLLVAGAFTGKARAEADALDPSALEARVSYDQPVIRKSETSTLQNLGLY